MTFSFQDVAYAERSCRKCRPLLSCSRSNCMQNSKCSTARDFSAATITGHLTLSLILCQMLKAVHMGNTMGRSGFSFRTFLKAIGIIHTTNDTNIGPQESQHASVQHNYIGAIKKYHKKQQTKPQVTRQHPIGTAEILHKEILIMEISNKEIRSTTRKSLLRSASIRESSLWRSTTEKILIVKIKDERICIVEISNTGIHIVEQH